MSKDDVIDLFENKSEAPTEKKFDRFVAHYLIHSYLYYILDSPIISDAEYDNICNTLLENLDTITHLHRHLLDKEALKAGSAYHLKDEDYPLIVKNTARMLLNESQEKK